MTSIFPGLIIYLLILFIPHKQNCRYPPLSFVTYWAWLISPSSNVIVVHVFLGLTLFLLPGSVQCRAIMGIILGAILITCPSHHIRLCFVSPAMVLYLLFLSISLLRILLGRKILLISRKQLLWKTTIFFMLLSIIHQHSDWFHIAVIEVFLCSQDCIHSTFRWSLANAARAFESLAFMSLPAPLSLIRTLPR